MSRSRISSKSLEYMQRIPAHDKERNNAAKACTDEGEIAVKVCSIEGGDAKSC